MLITQEEKMMEKFESEFRQRFNYSMRQTIINQYQIEEYNKKTFAELKKLPLVAMLEITNQFIPLKIAVTNPTIVTQYKKRELVILRAIFISIAFSADFTNKEIRDLLQTDRTNVLFQLKRISHIMKHKNVYEKEFELYTAILAQIVSENERLVQHHLHTQSQSESNVSFVLNQGQDYATMD